MIKIVSALVVMVGVAMAQPPIVPPGFGPGRGGGLLRNPLTPSEVAVTLRSINENVGDGNYVYEYETSDGTRVEQTGILRGPDPLNPEGVQAVRGSYSYISPEGIPITVNYIADENGFQPIGDHIPGNNLRLRGVGAPGVSPQLGGPAASPVAAAFAAQRLARPTPTPDPELIPVTPATNAALNPAVAAAAGIRNPYDRFALADPYNRFNPYVNPANPYALGAAAALPEYNRRLAGQNPYLGYNRGLRVGPSRRQAQFYQ